MEDKANKKALRKVIINLVPQEKCGQPVEDKDKLKIDISDKLEDSKQYCLYDIEVERGETGYSIAYVPFAEFTQFKYTVEKILDATIVNTHQRKAVQTLLDNAYYYNLSKFNLGV